MKGFALIAFLFWSSLSWANFVQTSQLSFQKEYQVDAGIMHYQYYHKNQEYNVLSSSLNVNKKIGKVDFITKAFSLLSVEESKLETFSVPELYFKIGKNLKVGRVLHEWTLYENFKPTGIANNTWDYNKALPSLEGLIGVYYSSNFIKPLKTTFFASPVSVPNITKHYKFSGGSVLAETPWFLPPSNQITYEDANYKVDYNLNIDYSKIVFAPQAGANLKYENKNYLLNFSYLYSPYKTTDLAVDFSMDASQSSLPVQVSIEPENNYMHKTFMDIGYKWNAASKTVLSVSYAQRNTELSIDERKSLIGASSGGLYQIFHEQPLSSNLKMIAHLTENTQVEQLYNGELGVALGDSLSDTQRFKRGVGLSLDYKFNSNLSIKAYNYYDVRLDGLLTNISVKSQFKKMSIYAAVSAVEALSQESSGFYRDFRENDLISLGAYYVF